MSWALKPRIPPGGSFNGQIVYPSIDLEFPLDAFINIVESISFSISDQYINKLTGFETKKYKVHDNTEKNISIMLVGDLEFWQMELLLNIATAMNSSGMILQWSDNFFTGTTSVPVLYSGRWINAGDFVENSALLCGGTIELVAYNINAGAAVDEYQKVIDIPDPALEWNYNIDTGVGIIEYQRVI